VAVLAVGWSLRQRPAPLGKAAARAAGLVALGHIRRERVKDGETSAYVGVVVTVSATRLMPTESEFRDLVREQEMGELPFQSRTHVQVFDPGLFAFEFEAGKKTPATCFLIPVKASPDDLAAVEITAIRSEKDPFRGDEAVTFCIGVVVHNESGRPLRVHLRDDIADVPPWSVKVSELPTPNFLVGVY
jgi:hypothetical protein